MLARPISPGIQQGNSFFDPRHGRRSVQVREFAEAVRSVVGNNFQ